VTYAEIKDLVMFQTNNDSEDLGDFMPYINGYVNEGYDRLVLAYAGEHTGGDYPPLYNDTDVPLTPAWTHKALSDWATWCIYKNGNPQKQQRGLLFRQSAELVESQIRSAGGSAGLTTKITAFTNIPE
jgi:hypothetical protein